MTTRHQILQAIQATGPGSAWDIALDTGLPTKRVNTALSRMLDRGQVRVVGVQRPETGRPARIFDLSRKA